MIGAFATPGQPNTALLFLVLNRTDRQRAPKYPQLFLQETLEDGLKETISYF